MNKAAAIRVKDLVKDFPSGLRGWTLRAVDHVNFDVPEGCVYGLLGPNGCGKSTTMKIVLGLLRPTSGTCELFGRSTTETLARRDIGFLPEAPYFYRYLTGREWVRLCGRLSGISSTQIESATDRALAAVDMVGAAQRRVGTYSKGMLQRIGLAQALVHDPKLVILDEPTAGVDPVGSAAIADIIRKLKAEGKTVLLCSHLLAQVEDVCDEITIMHRGRVRLSGRVNELLTQNDAITYTVRGASEAAQQAMAQQLSAQSGVSVKVGRERKRLDELFLEIVKEDTKP